MADQDVGGVDGVKEGGGGGGVLGSEGVGGCDVVEVDHSIQAVVPDVPVEASVWVDQGLDACVAA